MQAIGAFRTPAVRAVEWVVVLSLAYTCLDFGKTKKGTSKQQRVHSSFEATPFNKTLTVITPTDLAALPPTPSDEMPLLLHQSHKSLAAIPSRMKEWMWSWEHLHSDVPGWKHVFWTDEDNERLIKEELPEMYATYMSYPHYIQRADIARMAVLRKYGGVYADGDYECMKPDCMQVVRTAACDVFLVGSSNHSINGFFMNSLMAAKVNPTAASFWDTALKIAKTNANNNGALTWLGLTGQWGVLAKTGPALLSLAYSEMHGIDLEPAKDTHFNFKSGVFLRLFEEAGKVPKEGGEKVCSLSEDVYNGQARERPVDTQMTHHHNAGSWVHSVYASSTHLPRLLPALAVALPAFLLKPAPVYMTIAAAFWLLQSFPGSPLETITAVAFLTTALYLSTRVAVQEMKRVHETKLTPFVYLYTFITYAYIRWIL